jgi:choline dehydrogenase-like flavoprotein
MLGGSSSINYMLYVRGDKRNYDKWADEGCEGWSFDEVLPYFKRSEFGYEGGDPDNLHGTEGFLKNTSMKHYDFETKDTVQRFCDAGAELGLSTGDDYNGDTQEGAFFSQVTVKDGARHDTANAFLFHQMAMERDNLTVITETHVTKVLFQGDTATGVLCRKGTIDMKELQGIPDILISAKREVILSAGAVNTPWLLMLSGVGPKEHLAEMNIPVVKDLPGVGQNLQDHIMVYGPLFNCKPGQSVGFTDTSLFVGLKAMMNYVLFGTGTLLLLLLLSPPPSPHPLMFSPPPLPPFLSRPSLLFSLAVPLYPSDLLSTLHVQCLC